MTTPARLAITVQLLLVLSVDGAAQVRPGPKPALTWTGADLVQPGVRSSYRLDITNATGSDWPGFTFTITAHPSLLYVDNFNPEGLNCHLASGGLRCEAPGGLRHGGSQFVNISYIVDACAGTALPIVARIPQFMKGRSSGLRGAIFGAEATKTIRPAPVGPAELAVAMSAPSVLAAGTTWNFRVDAVNNTPAATPASAKLTFTYQPGGVSGTMILLARQIPEVNGVPVWLCNATQAAPLIEYACSQQTPTIAGITLQLQVPPTYNVSVPFVGSARISACNTDPNGANNVANITRTVVP